VTGPERKLVGLLGGSFDPIHAGHLALARAALTALPLDELRFIPAAQPWQKGALSDAAHRAHMVELAIAGEPRFVLDMHEIERGGTTYTVDTLRALRAGSLADAALVLVMGSDQFARFDTWRDWRSIADLAHLAIAHRGGTQAALTPTVEALLDARRCAVSELRAQPAGCIVEFAMDPVDASATEIRGLVRAGSAAASERLAALLAPSVLDYIRSHRLYI
jgi:nicotinate-nucleotide adenylyltransferase